MKNCSMSKRRFGLCSILFLCLTALMTLSLTGCPVTAAQEDPVPEYLYIATSPYKTEYQRYDLLDLSGMDVRVRYSDGSEKTVTDWTSNPEHGTELKDIGEVCITISYQNLSTNLYIWVYEQYERTPDYIYISKFPDKESYEYNEILDLTGLEVKARYYDGSEAVLDGWSASPRAGTILTSQGTVKVTISYGYSNLSTTFTITVAAKPEVTANEYFWGTWVRMDNGKEYEVLEKSVRLLSDDNYYYYGWENDYEITASDSETLAVSELGTFTKKSDSVMECNSIPYFRKGGANLEYSLKLVGFTQNGRAAGTAMSGIKGKGKSTKYSNFESNSESDAEGTIKFFAPTANDTQTVTIENGNELVVVSGLNVSNSGDYMGTVALVGKDDYNLKITGTISDDQKDNGYLFGNNAKNYDMILTITNISDNECSSSICIIESLDAKLMVEATDGSDLTSFPISTLPGNATKTVSLSLCYGDLDEPYVDTGITVTINNPFTGQEWKDYIPLRFFKGTIPITIAAKSHENNTNAALNGFIIYPDGNNQFFAIWHNDCKPIFVPTFGIDKPYMLVFSGATVTSELSNSTEMFYTVEPASLTLRPIVTSGPDLAGHMVFGGENHSETTAYAVTEGFEAYLRKGETDYYTIIADSDTYYGPGGSLFYSVRYENEKGDAPDPFLTTSGAVLSSIQLPAMSCDGYSFLGWYSGDQKAIAGGYTVYDNVTLTAKWQLESYAIDYELNGGSQNARNPSYYTIESSPIELVSPVLDGYNFDGWYLSENCSGSTIASVGGGSTGAIKLYAGWSPVEYSITYSLEGGTNSVDNPSSYTIESETITLANPYKEGYVFIGWESSSGSTTIQKGSTGNITFYAFWSKECTVTYVTDHGTAPDPIKIAQYNSLTDEQLPVLSNSDYYFGGWYIGENRIYSYDYTVEDDITLTAKWYDKCTVSYVTDYGSTPESFEVASGTSFSSSNLPTLRERGYRFMGWYTSSSYAAADRVSSGFSITESLTLYAKWESYSGPDDFVFVEGGTVVGSSDYNPRYTGAFGSGRTVTLSRFFISDHEVTQGEYYSIMGYNPSYLSSSPAGDEIQDNRPVEQVSWYDAIYFCNKYSEENGLTPCYAVNGYTDVSYWNYSPHNGNRINDTITCNWDANGYRLPTEAEWEYAARGGQEAYETGAFVDYYSGIDTTTYYAETDSNLDTVGWYYYNSDDITHEVKKKAPNALDLYDMTGNVWEWCWDRYDSIYTGNVTDPTGASVGSSRIARGGSRTNSAYTCSVSNRVYSYPYSRSSVYGFRLARTDTSSFYKISYSSEHGSVPAQKEVRTTITASELPVLSENGWTFDGWYFDSSYTQAAAAGSTVSGAVTLYAKWREKVSVSYISSYGSTPDSFYINSGDSLSSSDLPALSESGWVFVGWYFDSSYTQEATSGSTVSGSVTLYAKWHEYFGWEPVDNYSYYFVQNGTNWISNNKNISSSSANTTWEVTLTEPIRYTFSYSVSSERGCDRLTIYLDNSTIVNGISEQISGRYSTILSAGTHTLQAVYSKDSNVDSYDDQAVLYLPAVDYATQGLYELSYSTSYGTAPSSQGVEIGQILYSSDLPELSATGCRFLGWYIGDEEITEGYKITGNTTLTAKWEYTSYKITYTINGGKKNPKNPASYTIEDEIELLDPTYEGYTFAGWFTDSSFSNKLTKIERGTTGDIDLYARWGQAAGISVSLEELNDIELTYEKDGNYITFTGPEDFTSYEWHVDGSKVQTGKNTLTVNVSRWSTGRHVIRLIAKKSSSTENRDASVYVNIQ